jgi:hypothetical protein
MSEWCLPESHGISEKATLGEMLIDAHGFTHITFVIAVLRSSN